jgi:hypothetical protein
MPSGLRVKPETVARRYRRADAPARGRRACFQRRRRPQQQKRKTAIAGGEMQFLAGLEIEPVDHPRDGGRRGRMQRLRHGPQAFFAMRRFDQDQAGGIETEGGEAVAGNMSGKPAMLAQPIGRNDEDERAARRQAGKNGHDEAEGGGDGAFRLGHDFMERAAGQAALGQVGIKRGKAEGQGAAPGLLGGPDQATQFLHDGGAVSRH